MKKLIFILLLLTACTKEEINTNIFMDATGLGTFTIQTVYPGVDTTFDVTDYWSKSITASTGDTVELTVFTMEAPATISINNCITTTYGFSYAKLQFIAP